MSNGFSHAETILEREKNLDEKTELELKSIIRKYSSPQWLEVLANFPYSQTRKEFSFQDHMMFIVIASLTEKVILYTNPHRKRSAETISNDLRRLLQIELTRIKRDKIFAAGGQFSILDRYYLIARKAQAQYVVSNQLFVLIDQIMQQNGIKFTIPYLILSINELEQLQASLGKLSDPIKQWLTFLGKFWDEWLKENMSELYEYLD